MLIAPLDVQTTYVVRERGPADINPSVLRAGREQGQDTLATTRRAAGGTGARGIGNGIEIAGRSPSLSTGILGTLGQIGASSLNRLDPLTGKPMEVDPVTGEPVPADPLMALLTADQYEDDIEDEAAPGNRNGLTPEEQAEVNRLQAIDRQVRAREAAYMTARMSVTGAATFTYVTGPDGRQYAVAGDVPITVTASPADRTTTAAMTRAGADARAQDGAEATERQATGGPVGLADGGLGALPFAAAAAAYGQAGRLLGDAPVSIGGPTAIIAPRAMISLVA